MTPIEKFSEEVRDAQRDEEEAKNALVEYYREQEQQKCPVASTLETGKKKSKFRQVIKNMMRVTFCTLQRWTRISLMQRDRSTTGEQQ